MLNRLAGHGKDVVRVMDRGIARLRTRAGEIIAGREWGNEKSLVEVKGWVNIVMRERGKIVPGSRREGPNIWTNTGREFLALLMSLQSAPSNGFRSDRVAFIGVGTGAQPEEAGVLSVTQPVAYLAGEFMAPLDIPPTFPLTPTRTTVRYHRLFMEDQITLTPGSTVNLSEFGLYTNGRQSDFSVGLRDTTLAQAASQTPVAYKSFEPIGKKDSLQLEVSWEIRF